MSDPLSNALRGGSLLDSIAHPATVNPLAAYTGALQTARGVMDLQQLQSQRAAGQAFLNSINPDGTPNQSALLTNLRSDPSTAMAALDTARGGQGLDTATYNLHQARLQGARASMGQLISDYPDGPPRSAVEGVIASKLQTGDITPQEAQQLRSVVSDDPKANLALVIQGLNHNMNAQSVLEKARPAPNLTDTGTEITPITPQSQLGSGRYTGGATPGAGTPVYASPGTQGQQVTWQDTEGVTQYGTWAGYNIARNNGRVVGPPSIVGPQGGGAGGPQGAGAPSPTNQPRLAPAPSGGTQAPAAPAPSGGTAAQPPLQPTATPGPGIGVVSTQQKSADQYADDRAAAGTYQSRIYPLVQAANILSTEAPTTGKGADAVRTVIGHLQTLGKIFSGTDMQSIGQSKFEELGKYLQQAVNSQPFAAGSDQRLASALSGNPSTHMSNLTNQDVIKAMVGLERMRQMATTVADAQGVQPGQYAGFLRNWQTAVDPRAFMVDFMDDGKIKKMLDGMTRPGERTVFQNTLNLIRQHPDIMNTAPAP